MFRWIVGIFVAILVFSYLWPIITRSGKKTASTMFDEDESQQDLVNRLQIPPSNVVELHPETTPAATEPEHSLAEKADNA